MKIIGLTGSAAMGKSFVATLLRQQNLPVFDADSAVHQLYRKDTELINNIAIFCPEAIKNGAVERKILSEFLQQQPERLKRLNAIVHPAVKREQQAFIRQCQRRKAEWCVLDVPLLFESGSHMLCDVIMVVTAPEFVQRTRLWKRKGMNQEKLKLILHNQMKNKDKIKRADIVIKTGLSKHHTYQQVRDALISMQT